ncbi:hypothetical protein EIG89_16935, partial [Staphylococcus aureus]
TDVVGSLRPGPLRSRPHRTGPVTMRPASGPLWGHRPLAGESRPHRAEPVRSSCVTGAGLRRRGRRRRYG